MVGQARHSASVGERYEREGMRGEKRSRERRSAEVEIKKKTGKKESLFGEETVKERHTKPVE